MAGGITTLDLVAGVSKKGGLGSIGAAYMTPLDLDVMLKKLNSTIKNPYSVNLFKYNLSARPFWDDNNPALKKLAEMYKICDLTPFNEYVTHHDPYDEQLSIVVKHKTPIVSFTFGIPEDGDIDEIHRYGGKVWVTVTTLSEAIEASQHNIDALIIQGIEAGGHRASFNQDIDLKDQMSRDALLNLIANETSLPIISSGGLMSGHDINTQIERGAVAGQLGTLFLASDESGASQSWKQALSRGDNTILTRSFSGRMARGKANIYTNSFQDVERNVPPFPYMNELTKPLRRYAKGKEIPDYQSLWAGQNCAQVKYESTTKIMDFLIKELEGLKE